MMETQGSADSPNFLPNGDLVFRAIEDRKDYVYRKEMNGGATQKVLNEPVISLETVSPDGKWVIIGMPQEQDPEHSGRVKVFPLSGGQAVTLCRSVCFAQWDTSGKDMLLNWMQAVGWAGPEDTKEKAIGKIPINMSSAASADLYSYTKISIRRNIYRIPID